MTYESNSNGFSLIEVLISVMLITMAAGATFNAFYASQHFLVPGPHTAVRLIASKHDELKEYIRTDSVNMLDPAANPYAPEVTPLGGTDYTLNRSVAAALQGNSTQTRDYKYSTITVSWLSQD